MKVLIIGLMAVLLSPFVLANNLLLESSNTLIKTMAFDELKAMPAITYKTHLPWIEGEAEFTGVSLALLLKSGYGEIPKLVTFRALNDYSIDIAKADIEKYHPIVAYLKNGEKMTVREKGPYWIIFSLTDFPSIDNSEYHSQMIWQLEKIQIGGL